MQEQLNQRIEPKEEIDRLIFDWHNFPLDFWWRSKYKIPFGSQAHREMNFIDMLVEYREELIVNKIRKEIADERAEHYADDDLGGGDNVVHMSKAEIDEEYENLDLSQFEDK